VAPPSAARNLTPQEHQVVYLASQGLTNRQIGEMLHLSPRTVGAHLHRSFPKLGITRRQQLRDIPAPAYGKQAPDGLTQPCGHPVTCGSPNV
jgi:DNA-binding CsgD family transcriptional regulator